MDVETSAEQKRAELVAFYEYKAAVLRQDLHEFELMGFCRLARAFAMLGRTVQYLDDAGVALELGRIRRDEKCEIATGISFPAVSVSPARSSRSGPRRRRFCSTL